MADPWYTAIRTGAKTVEGRLGTDKFRSLQPGAVLLIRRSAGKGSRAASHAAAPPLVAVVVKTTQYASFFEYLTQEGLARTLPGTGSLADGVAVYRHFYSQDQERRHGVFAIHIMLAL